MEFIKQKIILISDLEHSKPRIPNLLFHLNNDVYDKLYFGKLEVLVSGKSKNLYFRIH